MCLDCRYYRCAARCDIKHPTSDVMWLQSPGCSADVVPDVDDGQTIFFLSS